MIEWRRIHHQPRERRVRESISIVSQMLTNSAEVSDVTCGHCDINRDYSFEDPTQWAVQRKYKGGKCKYFETPVTSLTAQYPGLEPQKPPREPCCMVGDWHYP